MSRAKHQSILLILAVSGQSTLAGADELDGALRRCAGFNEPEQRLSCFDEIVRRLPQVEKDRFGLTADIERKRDPLAVEKAKSAVLGAKIAGLRQAANGEWTFTLDNRQVWIEAEPRPSMTFAVGEDVRIEHGAMSSLWLVADQHRRVRVKRLQ
jgi:hypothetical protein